MAGASPEAWGRQVEHAWAYHGVVLVGDPSEVRHGEEWKEGHQTQRACRADLQEDLSRNKQGCRHFQYFFFVSVKLPETHRTQQKRVYLCFLEKEYRSSGKQTNKQQQQMNQQKLDKRFAVKLLNDHFWRKNYVQAHAASSKQLPITFLMVVSAVCALFLRKLRWSSSRVF